jgi:hypothetical protein
MSMKEKADPCSCAAGLGEGVVSPTGPVGTENPPGRNSLRYRLGTHGSFKESMIRAANRKQALRHHANRDDSSAATAFLDLAAVLLDNLSFYQERWLNEGYLATATERRSLLELARSIGYELSPGVAASTHLAFEVQTAPGMPETVHIPVGVQVQDIPPPGRDPQFFETIDSLEGRPEWNRFMARQSRPQVWQDGKSEITVSGTGLNLPLGSRLLVLYAPLPGNDWTTVEIEDVAEDFERKVTRFTLARPLTGPAGSLAEGFPKLYSFSAEARVFGSNAPDWRSLPSASKLAYLGLPEGGSVPAGNRFEWPNYVIHMPFTFPSRYDGLHHYVTMDAGSVLPLVSVAGDSVPGSEGLPPVHESLTVDPPALNEDRASTLSLDNEYKQVLPGSLILLDDPAGLAVAEVEGMEVASRSAFAVSGKSTVVTADASILGPFREGVRSLSVLVGSRELALAGEVDDSPVSGTRIRIPSTVPGPPKGRFLSIEGEDVDTGEAVSQIVSVKSVSPQPGEDAWLVELNEPLDHACHRATAIIRGNILPATHGQTHVDVLGHGDARRKWTKMPLKQPPLTYLSSDTDARGIESTLSVEVDGIAWKPVDSFHRTGADDEVYSIRHTDDGQVIVQFGDGKTGRRLPTGSNNVKASYRSGTGSSGNMDAGRLTSLMTRPLGLSGVSHPVPAEGGEDPEKRENARENAPLTVKTLDRLVSLRDYADFARAFAGIAKAQSVWGTFGPTQGILLTIAGPDGAEIADDSRLGRKFHDALERYRDPTVPFAVLNHRPLPFTVVAKVYYDSRYNPELIRKSVAGNLSARYSFESMRLGEAVTSASLLEGLHGIDGIVGVDLDRLHRIDRPAARETRIPAETGRVDPSGAAHPAELLSLDARVLEQFDSHLSLYPVDPAPNENA